MISKKTGMVIKAVMISIHTLREISETTKLITMTAASVMTRVIIPSL
jgi:hypothetical protein